MKLRNLLLNLSLACALSGYAQAISVTWGNEVLSELRDSFGNLLDDTYQFQLGFFESTFQPVVGNTAQWASHWKVFDQAQFDPAIGYFASTVTVNQDGSSASTYADPLGLNGTGNQAYIWIYNSKTPEPGSQWFVVRSAGWVFPTGLPADGRICCDNRQPLEWSITDLKSTDTPLYGKQGGTEGPGEYTQTGVYSVQTFTFVPEPAAAMLLAIGGLSAALRRRRTDG